LEHAEHFVKQVQEFVQIRSARKHDFQWSILSRLVCNKRKLMLACLLARRMLDHQNTFSEFTITEHLETFVLKTVKDKVIEFGNNGQGDKVENNADCVISRADNANTGKLHIDATCKLQKSCKPSDLVIFKIVRVIQAVLHLDQR